MKNSQFVIFLLTMFPEYGLSPPNLLKGEHLSCYPVFSATVSQVVQISVSKPAKSPFAC